MKLKRGQKLCSNCNNTNGARAYVCKHCNHEFISKPTSKNKKVRKRKPKKFQEITNWKELNAGDKIKVIGRSGTYYIGDDGERQYMTEAGIYKIQSQDDKGLVVYGDYGGFGYIYMGPEIRSDIIPNMYRCPHKILKVNVPNLT